MDRRRRKMLPQMLILMATAHVLCGQQPTDFAVPTSGTVNLLINPSVEILPTNQTDLTASSSNASSSTSGTDMVIAPPSQSTILDLMEKYSSVVNASPSTTSNFPIRVQDPVNPQGKVNILQSSPEWANAPSSEASQVNIISVPSNAAVVSTNLIANPDLSISSTQQPPSDLATETLPVQDPSSVIIDSFAVRNTLGQSMPLKEMISAANPAPSSGQLGNNPILDTQHVLDSLPNPPSGTVGLSSLLDLSAVPSAAPNDSLLANMQSNFGFETPVGSEPLAIGGSNFPSSEFSVFSSSKESKPFATSSSVSQPEVFGQETIGGQVTSTGFDASMNVPVDQLSSFPSSSTQQPSPARFESLANVQFNTIAGQPSGKTNVLTGNELNNQSSSLDVIPLDLQNIPENPIPFQANSGAMTTDMKQSGIQSTIDSFNVNANQQTNTLSNTPPPQSGLLVTDNQPNPEVLSSEIPASSLPIPSTHQPEAISTQTLGQQNVVSSAPITETQNSMTAHSGSALIPRGPLTDTSTSSNQQTVDSSGMNRGNILNFPTETQLLNIPQASQSSSPQQRPPMDSVPSSTTNLSTTISLTEIPVPPFPPMTSAQGQQEVQNSNPIPSTSTLVSQQPLLQQSHANQVPNHMDSSALQPALSNQQPGGPADISQNTEQNPQIALSVNDQKALQQNLANRFPNDANPIMLRPTQDLSTQQLNGSSTQPINPQISPSTLQQNYENNLPNFSSKQILSDHQFGTSMFQPQNGVQNPQMFPSANQQQTLQQNTSIQIPHQNNQNPLLSNHSQSLGQNSPQLKIFRQNYSNQVNVNAQDNLPVQQNGQLNTQTAFEHERKTIQNSKILPPQGMQQLTNQQSIYPYSQQSIPNQPVRGVMQNGQEGPLQQTVTLRQYIPHMPNNQQNTQQNLSNKLPNMLNANFQNLPVTAPSSSSPIGNNLNQGINKNTHNLSYRTTNISGVGGHVGHNPLAQLRNMYQQANANFNQYSGRMQGLSGHNTQRLNNVNAQAAQRGPNMYLNQQAQVQQPVNARNNFHNYFPSTNLNNPAVLKSNFQRQIVQNNLGIKNLPSQQYYASLGTSPKNVASPNSAWSPVYQNQIKAEPKINKNKEWEKFGAFQVILNASPAHVLRQASLPQQSTGQQFKTSRAAQIPLKTSQNIYWGSYTRTPSETGITMQDFKLPNGQMHMQTAQAVQAPPQLSTQNLSKLAGHLPPSYRGLSQIKSSGLQSNNTLRDFAARLTASQTPPQVSATSPQMVNPPVAVNNTTELKNVSIPPSKPIIEKASQPSHTSDPIAGVQASPDLAALRQLAGNVPVSPAVPRRKALLYTQGSRGELPTGAATYRNTGSAGNNMLMNMMLMQRLEQMGEGGGSQMNIANMMRLLNPRANAALNARMTPTTQHPPRTLTEALGYYDPIMKEFIPKQAVYGPELGVKRTPAKSGTTSTTSTGNYGARKGQNPTFNKAMAVIENARLKAFNQIKQQPRPFLLNQFFQWKNRSGTAAIAPKITEFIQYLKETITKVMPLFIPSHTQQAPFKRSAKDQNSKDYK